jgi:hypothetical protein
MHTDRSARALRLAVALVASALLFGCDKGADGDAKQPDARKTNAVAAAAAEEEPTPAPTAAIVAGQPWATAEAYLKDLEFVGDTAEHEEFVNVCKNKPDCSARLRLRPERRAHGLKTRDFASGQRVVARFERRDANDVAPLGFVPANSRRESWLLVTSPTTAVVMFESAGKVAFTNLWTFELRSEASQAGKLKAQWLNVDHVHGDVFGDTAFIDRRRSRGVRETGRSWAVQDTSLINHLQSAWVSCAEGCCNATSTQ